jgi:hypothetical protein
MSLRDDSDYETDSEEYLRVTKKQKTDPDSDEETEEENSDTEEQQSGNTTEEEKSDLGHNFPYACRFCGWFGSAQCTCENDYFTDDDENPKDD